MESGNRDQTFAGSGIKILIIFGIGVQIWDQLRKNIPRYDPASILDIRSVSHVILCRVYSTTAMKEFINSTRKDVSKHSRADLQYLGLKTTLKKVSFYLFCWVLLCQYSKKFDFPGTCLVSLVTSSGYWNMQGEAVDPRSTLWLA